MRIVNEVQHIRGFFPRVAAVHPRKRLHCLNARKFFINVHPAKQRLIESGLKLIGHQENLILVTLERLADVAAFEVGVQLWAGFFERVGARFLVIHFTGESYDGFDVVAFFLDVLIDCQLPANGFYAATDNHHRFCFAAYQRGNQYSVVLDDDLNFLRNVVGVKPNPTHQALQSLALFNLCFVPLLTLVGQFESQFVGRVVQQNIENELFFNRLLHRVDVERPGQILLALGFGWIGETAERF